MIRSLSVSSWQIVAPLTRADQGSAWGAVVSRRRAFVRSAGGCRRGQIGGFFFPPRAEDVAGWIGVVGSAVVSFPLDVFFLASAVSVATDTARRDPVVGRFLSRSVRSGIPLSYYLISRTLLRQ